MCFNPLLLTLSSSSFFRYRSIVSTSATLKNEGLFASLSSLPKTGWNIIGKRLFGSSSQPSMTFLWTKYWSGLSSSCTSDKFKIQELGSYGINRTECLCNRNRVYGTKSLFNHWKWKIHRLWFWYLVNLLSCLRGPGAHQKFTECP